MLIIKNKQKKNRYEYQLQCYGTKEQYQDFINTVASIPDKYFNTDAKLWETNIKGLQYLSNAYNLPTQDTIGTGMKLQLFEYQKEAIFSALSAEGGCLLKLPCGAGKTPIGIGLYHELKRQHKISGKGLIVVKASIKIQWPKEVEKFSNYSCSIVETFSAVSTYLKNKIKKIEKQQEEYINLDAVIYSEEIAALEKEKKKIKKDMKTKFADQFAADLLVLNYETLNDEHVIKQLKKEPLDFVYADEIHVIKSPSAKRSRSLYKLNYVPYVFGATATPIQKNPLDIYSIYKFLRPGLFKSSNDFKSVYIKYNQYGFPVGAQNEELLNRRIKPYMVIKSQEEVSKELPDLQVLQAYCTLTDKQIKMTQRLLQEIQDLKEQQQAIVSKYCNVEEARSKNTTMTELDAQILARQTFCQELANSEDLLRHSDSHMAKQYITGSSSNKISRMLDLMDEIFSSGEKVCVFSKYKKLQPILDKAILERFPKIKIAHVNSDYSDKERYEQVYTCFRDNDEYKVLLMSDAGAEGQNLEKCQYLIEFEPADSYLIQTQRRGRIVRASSTHDTVYVYQLIAEQSYDEIAMKVVDKKEDYMKNIVES